MKIFSAPSPAKRLAARAMEPIVDQPGWAPEEMLAP